MLTTLKSLLPHKLRAFSIHFLISLALFAVLFYLILFHWYPMPWFPIDGGWQGVRIMIGVDLVLGPLLTFIIFNPAKGRREMTLDFSLIALVQISAMIWGIYLVHGQRPLAIVHWNGAFHSVDSKSPGFKDYPIEKLDGFGKRLPVIVFQQDPESEDEKIAMAMAIFGNDQAEHEHPSLWRPLTAHLDETFKTQVDIQALTTQSPDSVRRLLGKYPETKPEDLRYVAFDGRYEQATLVFKPDGTLIGSLPPLAPPPPSKPKSQPAQGKG